MSTPTETAAEAVIAADLLDRYVPADAEDIAWDATKTALASLAQHRDDIARVLYEFQVRSDIPLGIAPGPAWGDLPDEWRTGWREAADAVLAYLTGGAS